MFYEKCGNDKPLSVIAGPCIFEDPAHAVEMALALKEACDTVGQKFDSEINFIYKTSFDKANRSSADSYRGSGFDEAFYGMEAVRARGIEVIMNHGNVMQLMLISFRSLRSSADRLISFKLLLKAVDQST